MDKRITYERLKDMMQKVPAGEVHLDKLRSLIIMNIGSTERTIYSCLRIMSETKMIKDLGNSKFKVLKGKL